MQTDLDAALDQYNNERGHQGRQCYGETPMRTLLDSPELAREKLIPLDYFVSIGATPFRSSPG